MATRYPLVIDITDNNKIKELPDGDNLNLSNNNIVNVIDITASGSVTVGSLSIDTANFTVAGQTLESVAFTGRYEDLDGLPLLFSGNYIDLQGKPTLKNTTLDLDDVSITPPQDDQILVYKANLGYYQPQNLPQVSNSLITDLQNVSFAGLKVNDVLTYNGIFWSNKQVDFADLSGTENVLVQGNQLVGDLKGSVFSNNSTLLVDGVNGFIPYSVINNAPSALSDFSNDLDYALIIGTTLQNSGIPINTRLTGDILDSSGTDTIINPTTKTFFGTFAGTTTGLHDGDVTGSIFSDSSTAVLDVINNKLFADVNSYQVEATLLNAGSITNKPDVSLTFSINASPGTLSMSIRGANETGTTQGTPLSISPGNNTDYTAQGGELLIIGGTGNPGGPVEIYGGNARNSGKGGDTFIAGGANVDGSGTGGDLHIRGGRDIVNDTNNGNIYIGDSHTKNIYVSSIIDFSSATVKNIQQFTKFYYNGGTTPVSLVSPSNRLGYTIGTWTEMTQANQASLGLGPTDSAYNPTLTGISFDPTNAEFRGFLQDNLYYISVNLRARISGTGVFTSVLTYDLELQTRNQNQLLYNSLGNITKLPDSVYGGASYVPWYPTVSMSLYAKFENADPLLNIVRITLDTDQSQDYHIEVATIEIIKL